MGSKVNHKETPPEPETALKALKVSVAFSGSGFRFPAHVGALCALIDMGLDVVSVAGTSGGSIIAALYATGMDPLVMKHLTLTTDFSFAMKKRWWGWWSGVCSSEPLYNWLDIFTHGKMCKDTRVPFKAISTDLYDDSTFIFGTEETPGTPVAFAAVCSASIPFIYPYRRWKGKILVDGGVRNDIPVDKLSNQYRRIGIMLEGDSKILPDPSITDLASRCLEAMMSANDGVRERLGASTGADIVVIPTRGISAFNANLSVMDRQTLFDSGYQIVRSQL